MTKSPPIFPPCLCVSVVVFLILAIAGQAEDELVFSDNFRSLPQGELAPASGWEIISRTAGTKWEIIGDGALKISHCVKPYCGNGIKINIPEIKKGRLEFDAQLGGGDGTLSLTVGIYGIFTAFDCRYEIWQRYEDKPLENEHQWKDITRGISRNKWHHFCINFDREKNQAIYSVNDPEFFTLLDKTDVLDGPPVLSLGDYGLCNTPVVNHVRNIRLYRTIEKQSVGGDGRRQANDLLIVHGLSSQRYRLNEACGRLPDTGKLREIYVLNAANAQNPTRNYFTLDRCPTPLTFSKTGTIILADVPLDIGSNSGYFYSELEQWVKAGGKLIVLGGFFTLGKAGFQGSVLEKMLPVEMNGAWEIKKADPPLALNAAAIKFPLEAKLEWAERPRIFFYHDIRLKKNAQCLIKIKRLPLYSCCAYGEGAVAVFAGTAYGKSSVEEQGFWEWKDWPALMADMINFKERPGFLGWKDWLDRMRGLRWYEN